MTPTDTPIGMGAGKVLAKPAVIAPMAQGSGTNVCAKYGFGGTDCVATSYYNLGGQRVAMRVQRDVIITGTVFWLHSDHLGSASLTTDESGKKVAELRFKPWGEVRWSNGAMPTDKLFTGMTTHAALGGLVSMGVREYLPTLGRWLSADTMVPDFANPQSLNRLSYVENRPLVANDPSGHDLMLVSGYCQECNDDYIKNVKYWENWIRAYKGWSQTVFENFMLGHNTVASLKAALEGEGIRLFEYRDKAQGAPITDQDVQDLSDQMSGMSNVTLVGHSKGANLVMNYISKKGATEVQKFIINKAPQPNSWQASVSGSRTPGDPFSFGSNDPFNAFISNGASTKEFGGEVVNIYSGLDIFGNMHGLDGAINQTNNDSLVWRGRIETRHGRGSFEDAKKAFVALNVYRDDNQSSWGVVSN